MNPQIKLLKKLMALATVVFLGIGLTTANATEPCDDFGECKVLIEINATDGDIGFHFLMDGDDLLYGALYNPNHRKIFSYFVRRELKEQTLTETFAESAEPLCWEPEEGDDEFGEDFVTLEEFLDRWSDGTYHFFGIGEGWEFSHGVTPLTFDLPAAPDLECDGCGFDGSKISWGAGDDLGECADDEDIDDLLGDDVLETHPKDVVVAAWEVVLEPDLDPDPLGLGALVFSIRVPVGQFSVTVPADYLLSLPIDTPVKIEVGAIGVDDNATFTEEDGFCVNGDGCVFE